MSKYNVYSETDTEALKSAIRNLGLEPLTRKAREATAQELIHHAIESLCDGAGEDEAERCLTEEVLAAKERLQAKA